MGKKTMIVFDGDYMIVRVLGRFETKAEAQAKAISMAQKLSATSQMAIAKMEKLIAGWEETDANNALAELEDSL
jgi:hypothetical protein